MSAELYLPPNVEDPRQQRDVIVKTTSLAGYTDFYQNHFIGADSESGINCDEGFNHVVLEQGDRKGNEFDQEYFRFLTFIGYICSQQAVDLLEGYKRIHYKRTGKRRYVSGPLHQLAIGSLLAYANEKIYEPKNEVRREVLRRAQMQGRDGRTDGAYHGIWGVFYRVQSGEVAPLYLNKSMDEKIKDADDRARERRHIALPVPELNAQLARLHLTAERADSMTKEEFMRDIYPKLGVFSDYFNAEMVFNEDPQNQGPTVYAPKVGR